MWMFESTYSTVLRLEAHIYDVCLNLEALIYNYDMFTFHLINSYTRNQEITEEERLKMKWSFNMMLFIAVYKEVFVKRVQNRLY